MPYTTYVIKMYKNHNQFGSKSASKDNLLIYKYDDHEFEFKYNQL